MKTYQNCYEITDLNKNLKDIKTIIKASEDSYKQKIKETVNAVVDGNYKMILIAGPSGSGKTTTSNIISQELLKHNIGSLVVSIDDFFIDLKDTPLLEDGTPDFENVKSVDIKAFNKFYKSILTKGKAKMPHYDFLLHKRGGWEKVEIKENDILIVEGIHALNPILTQNEKLKDKIFHLYVCVDSVFSYNGKVVVKESDLRLMRRCYRDAFTRNLTPDTTFQLWTYVCKGEAIYTAPYKEYSNIVIDTARNYEIMIFANYLPDLLKPYSDNKQIKDLISKLENISPIDRKLVPASSMLWEFLGKKEQ